MKIKRVIFAVFVLAGCFAGASYGQTTPSLPRGLSTINFKGTVYETRKTLTLNLKPGQKVTLSVTSSTDKVIFDAYYYPAGEEMGTPLTTETKIWTGELPKATKFTIDLYTPDNTKAKYKFTVQVLK
jgi:type 1 fimbria pilin